MDHIRIDLHKRESQICIETELGEVIQKRIRTDRERFEALLGGRPRAKILIEAMTEAEWVAREFTARMADEHYTGRDCAVLYRTNAQSRALEEAFRRARMPYQVVGAVSFYNRREVKDLVAYLRLIVIPADDEAFLRATQVPKRGLGLSTLATLQGAAAQWGQPLLAAAAIRFSISAPCRPRRNRPNEHNKLNGLKQRAG